MDTTVVKKEQADPLPYVIVFAILFLISLGLLTWVLSLWYKADQCGKNPNIWCSDTWSCNNNRCLGYNYCFENIGATGLASCLYGPNSVAATVCYNLETTGDTGATLCDCPQNLQNVQNCFSGCGTRISGSVTKCCCCPGTPGCTEEMSAGCFTDGAKCSN